MADKVEVRPLDDDPPDLALPAAIDHHQRLKAEDWRITGVSITQKTADLIVLDSPFFRQVEVGLPELSATLLPRNPAALREVDQMVGSCFFIGRLLFRIRLASVTIGEPWQLCGHDGIRVDIDAQAIWRQDDECDSRRELPAPSLP